MTDDRTLGTGQRPGIGRRAVLAFAAAIPLAGCDGSDDGEAGDPDGTAEAGTRFNQADADFLPAAIQLTTQSFTLTEAAREHAARAEIREFAADLAESAEADQGELTPLYQRMGEQPGLEQSHDHGESAHEIPGMIPEDEMAALQSAEGDFDDIFLRLVRNHHEGVVDLATTEVDEGSHAGLVSLAAQMKDAHRERLDRIVELAG